MKCRKELNQLAEDIPVYRTYLVQASKDMEAEDNQALMIKEAKDADLRQRMEAVNIAEQNLSIELTGLMEQRKSIRKKATEKTELKIKTDRELFQLNFSSGSTSNSHLENNEKKTIQKMEKSVLKLKNKLEEMDKQERILNERIQTTQGNLDETTRNLVELRKKRELLRALPTTSNPISVVRVKALKAELRKRLDRFAYLEEHLIVLNSKRIIDDIRLKKKEWFESYDCHDDDADA